MQIPANAVLIGLGDTDLSLAEEAQDIRGRKVADSDGEELGRIDDLLIDSQEKKVRFLNVASGGVLGLGAQKFLIPVEAIVRIDKSVVHISRTREHVSGAPAYDPKLVFDEKHAAGLYAYWGLAPYWAGGYVYPTWPFLPP